MAELNKKMDDIINLMDHNYNMTKHNEYSKSELDKVEVALVSYIDEIGLSQDSSINASIEANVVTDPNLLNEPGIYNLDSIKNYMERRKEYLKDYTQQIDVNTMRKVA